MIKPQSFALNSVEYVFIAITSSSTLIWSSNVFKSRIFGYIDLFKIIHVRLERVKKLSRNNKTINVNINVQWTRFLNI